MAEKQLVTQAMLPVVDGKITLRDDNCKVIVTPRKFKRSVLLHDGKFIVISLEAYKRAFISKIKTIPTINSPQAWRVELFAYSSVMWGKTYESYTVHLDFQNVHMEYPLMGSGDGYTYRLRPTEEIGWYMLELNFSEARDLLNTARGIFIRRLKARNSFSFDTLSLSPLSDGFKELSLIEVR